MLVQHRMRLIVPGRGVPSLGGHDGEIPAGFFLQDVNQWANRSP